MKRITIVIALFLILLISANLYPQEVKNAQFPTLLMVKYQNGYILINFEPLKDPAVTYKIYRSTSAILKESDLTDNNLIKTIEAKNLPFKDTPKNEGIYYYAVIASKNGKDFKKLIPLQNTLIYPVDFSPYPEPVKITKIKRQKDDKISIQISPVKKDWKYFFYTSSKQILNVKELKPVQIISGPKNSFIIKIERGKDYYFAVTVQNRLGVKNNKLIPGQNATAEPFRLEKKKQPSQPPKPAQKIQPKHQPKVQSNKKTPAKTVRKETIANRPKISFKRKPSTEALISRTISLYFIKGNYIRTVRELNWILKKYKTTNKQKSKIYFYLGQSYFYIKNYRKALKYFILCKNYSYYRKEADAWIDRVLRRIN